MKVLFATPMFPMPVVSGIQRRMCLSLEVLTETGEVTVISHGDAPSEAHVWSGILGRCRAVHVISQAAVGISRRRGWRRLVSGLKKHVLDGRPYCIRSLDLPEWHRVFAGLQPDTFDLVWMQSLGLYGQVQRYGLRRVIVDLPDADSIKIERELRQRPITAELLLQRLDLAKLRRAEGRQAGTGHWFVVSSERDRQWLSRRGNNLWVVRNAVELPAKIDDSAEEPDSLVFVGSLGYKPNRDAVAHFARDIFPLILNARPGVRFVVVGSHPTQEVEALADGSRIVVTGTVESVEPYLRRACVVVAPILSGSGTSHKIAHALSHAKAVVSTSVGAESMGLGHGRELLVADKPGDFASCCLRLLGNAGWRRRLGHAGRDFVARNLRVEQAREDVGSLLRRVFGSEAWRELVGEARGSEPRGNEARMQA